jgi:2-dehydro-3-deoxygluconokinase
MNDLLDSAWTESAPEIITLGEPLIEFNQHRADQPDLYIQGFGGDTSNVAIAAARLGGRVGYITRVGDDRFGRQLLELWQREGVDTRAVARDPDAPTGVYFVTHGPNGHEFNYLRANSAASRINPDALPKGVIQQARLLHVSGISQAISSSACDAVAAAISLARASRAVISYDPNLRLKLWPLERARTVIMTTIAQCDLCLPSLEDARLLFATDSADAIIAAVHEAGARIVVLKCGAKGCIVSNGNRIERIAGHPVLSVDATGAGDCFDGAFAVRVLGRDDVFAAARYANAAAALATTGYGAVAPLPYDGAVRKLLGTQ